MLSASDAGRIGRLVLPKKCAEVNNCLHMQLRIIVFLFDWVIHVERNGDVTLCCLYQILYHFCIMSIVVIINMCKLYSCPIINKRCLINVASVM